jgi:hypothetical protein
MPQPRRADRPPSQQQQQQQREQVVAASPQRCTVQNQACTTGLPSSQSRAAQMQQLLLQH